MKFFPTSIWGIVLYLVFFTGCTSKTEEKEPVSQDIPITTSSEEAIGHFVKTNVDGMYPKYLLAMAYEKSGNAAASTELMNEISDYNFNNVGYALVRV